MSYSTSSDLSQRLTAAQLIQLADVDGDGVADAAVIARAIADGDALIDSYAGNRHLVPFATVPDAVRRASVDLAIYNLQLGRDSVTEDVRKQFEATMSWLRDLSTGKASVGMSDTPQAGDPAQGVQSQKETRLWTRDELSQW